MKIKKSTIKNSENLLKILEVRFKAHPHRHKNLDWSKVKQKLESQPEKLATINEMEQSGGEPDVIGFDKDADAYVFYDCSAESPKGRRSLCYDKKAWDSRKKNKPKDNAIDVANAMGVEMLSEDDYRKLQQIEDFDTKTSSWVSTPEDVRKLGGAIFCDRRFGRVFTYHNGAESYYGSRGFRTKIIV